MILVPPKTLDYECSAPVEDYPVWAGGTYSTTTYEATPPELLRKVAVDETSGDMWGIPSIGSRKLYKKSASATLFTEIVTIGGVGDILKDIAVDLSGWVYIAYFDYSENATVVYRVHPLTYEVAGPVMSVAGANVEACMSLDTFLGDVFLSIENELYKYTNSTGVTAVHATISETSIVSLSVNPDTKDIYIGTETPYNILKQTASTGALVEIASDVDYVYGVSVDWSMQRVFAYDPAGPEIFCLYPGESVFESLGSAPYDIVSMSLSGGSLYFPYSTRLNIGVFSNSRFAKDAYVIYNSGIYLALTDFATAIPGTDDTAWFYYAPTNPAKMFDELLITKTEEPGGDLYFTVLGPDIDTIGLFNLSGATSATLRVFDSGGLISTTTKTITERNIAFNDVADGLIYEVNIVGTLPACGGVVAGVSEYIGSTLWGVNMELVSYSKVVVDDFGRSTFTRRGRAKKITCPVWVQMSEVNRLYELFNANDAKFCMWQGSSTESYLLIYGYYKRFDMLLQQLSGTKYSIEIMGDVDTE